MSHTYSCADWSTYTGRRASRFCDRHSNPDLANSAWICARGTCSSASDARINTGLWAAMRNAVARWFQPRSSETSESVPQHPSSRQSSTCVSPESIRQPTFESDDDEEEHHQSSRSTPDKRLNTAALKALKTKLILEDIPSWVVDLRRSHGSHRSQ